MKINEYLTNHIEQLETDPNEENEEMQDEEVIEMEHTQNYYRNNPDLYARTEPE